jgi:hypothetical protein
VAVDERAVAPAARDQAVGGEALERGPQRRAADAEPLGELRLRRKPAGGERAAADRLEQSVARALGQGPGLEAVEVRVRGGDRFIVVPTVASLTIRPRYPPALLGGSRGKD